MLKKYAFATPSWSKVELGFLSLFKSLPPRCSIEVNSPHTKTLPKAVSCSGYPRTEKKNLFPLQPTLQSTINSVVSHPGNIDFAKSN